MLVAAYVIISITEMEARKWLRDLSNLPEVAQHCMTQAGFQLKWSAFKIGTLPTSAGLSPHSSNAHASQVLARQFRSSKLRGPSSLSDSQRPTPVPTLTVCDCWARISQAERMARARVQSACASHLH